MANKYFKGPIQTYEGEIKQLFGKIVVGATGAITSQSNKGFYAARTAAGRYRITMGRTGAIDTYYEFKNLQAIVEGPTTAAAADGILAIIRNVDVTTGFSTIDLQIVDEAGADADATSGNNIYITITVKNSSVEV